MTLTTLKAAAVTGAALAILAFPIAASAAGEASLSQSRPILLAQADTETAVETETVVETDPIALAEQAVNDARAELRKAMATGGDVNAARRHLREALQQLDDAKEAAAAEAAPATETPAETTAEQAPPEDQPPAAAETEAAEQASPTEDQSSQTPGQSAEDTAPTAEQPQAPEQPQTAEQPAPPSAEPAPNTAAAPEATDDGSPLLRRNRNLANPPRFGRAQPNEQPAQLPTDSAKVSEGAEINAGAGRVIVKEEGQVTIRHDDTDRFRRLGGTVEEKTGPNGITTTITTRPNGTEVVTVRDEDGAILQRYRKAPNGQIEMLIGEAPSNGQPPQVTRRDRQQDRSFDFHRQLPPLRLQIPQQQYIVESSGASQSQLEQALAAPPVERVERAYSLQEIQRSQRLRDKVRRVDLDEITFEFGSAELAPDQIAKMERVGQAIQDIISQNDQTVILIEGHTDAVGSDLANLALSDRRAETVANILTYYFGIPPENLITQGYGEQFLKVPTSAPERLNRRAAFRNITWLLQASAQ